MFSFSTAQTEENWWKKMVKKIGENMWGADFKSFKKPTKKEHMTADVICSKNSKKTNAMKNYLCKLPT